MTTIENERQAMQLLRESIWEIKTKLGFDHAPPFNYDSNIVSDELKIIVKVGQHPLADGEGFYTEGPPPTILIDPQQSSEERRNFTFYHEVTHHMIRQNDALYEFITEHAYHNFEQTLEHYCNVGAAEFLIPLETIKNEIKTEGFSVKLIQKLGNQHSASKPAIAIQLAQAANHKCIILVCKFGNIPTKNPCQKTMNYSQSQDCLYIQYASSSPTCKYSCARYVVVPKIHLIYGVYKDGQYCYGQDVTLFKSGNNFRVYCEAFKLHNSVFAELRFSDPVSANQLSLFQN